MTAYYTITGKKFTFKAAYKAGTLSALSVLKGKLTQEGWSILSNYIPAQESDIAALQQKFHMLEYRKLEATTPSLYKQFVLAWFIFMESVNGVEPKFSGVDGRAMKQLIAYLLKAHSGDQDAALEAWKAILKQWHTLPAFYRNKTDVVYINAKLNEIITLLKNEQSNEAQAHRDAADLRRKVQD